MRFTWLRVIVIGGLLVVVAVAVVTYFTTRSGSAEYRLEPVGKTSVPAFTRPVGNDQKNVVSSANAGQAITGNTPGLYGGKMDTPVCDRRSLIEALRANPAAASSWSRIQGIRPSEIPGFVDQLSGVILRSDTYVKNYGYHHGVTSHPSILEAGTAVFVDKHGAPVVKCNCGNPLKPSAPQEDDVTTVGPAWPHISLSRVTVIKQSQTIVNQITVVQIEQINQTDQTDQHVLIDRTIGEVNGGESVHDVILPKDDYPGYIAMPGEQGAPDLPPPPITNASPMSPPSLESPTTEPSSGPSSGPSSEEFSSGAPSTELPSGEPPSSVPPSEPPSNEAPSSTPNQPPSS